jgi:hypothetical protein
MEFRYRCRNSTQLARYIPVGLINLHHAHFTARWVRGTDVLEFDGMVENGRASIVESLQEGFIKGNINIRVIFYQRVE